MTQIFNKDFVRLLLVQVLASLITLVIAITVSLYVGGKIEKLTDLFDSVDAALGRIESLVEIGPEGIAEVSSAIDDSATVVGEAVGDGGAEIVDRVGDAWNNFRSSDDD